MFKSMRYSLVLVTALLLSFSVHANVIYNVTVDVTPALGSSGGSAVYSFSMAFPDGNSPKTQTDLLSSLPSNDFTNEQLVVNGVQWTLVTDGAVTSLTFDPATLALSFTSADVFETVNGIFRYTTTSGFTSTAAPFYRCELVNPQPGQGGCGVSGQIPPVPVVTVTRANVPVPSVLALLAIGIPGIWLRVRRTRGSRVRIDSEPRAAR